MAYNDKSKDNLKRGRSSTAAKPSAELTENSPPCCLNCHFTFEEANVFQYLPERVQVTLRREHDRMRRGLQRGKIDAELLTTHSQAEEAIFAQFVPTELRERMTAEHRKIECVLKFLYSRE